MTVTIGKTLEPPSVLTAPHPDPSGERPAPVLDVVVPVHNEEVALTGCVERLLGHLTRTFPYRFRITIADNASTDGTWLVAQQLAARFGEVHAVHLDAKGRGRALHHVWSTSDAAVLAYMDVDLSTDLAALAPLVAPLLSGHSELAIGTRLARGARVVRGPKREVISRCYNLILRGTLAAGFSDAQCGFKAIRGDVARRLLPLVEDTGWFFDTELLVLAERAGLRIHEVPVDWVDDPDSRVDILSTATDDLRGVWRVGRALATGRLPLADVGHALRPELSLDDAEPGGRAGSTPDPAGVPSGLTGQLIRFAAVGLLSTLAYVGLYAVLRTGTGPQVANLLALLVTAVGNAVAHTRLTFGARSRRAVRRHRTIGVTLFALTLAGTASALAVLDLLSSGTHRALEVAVLLAVNLWMTGLRFVSLRSTQKGQAVRRSRPRSGS
ncbi:glycosyltransferase [Spongisporangium articulatum]|uniref:dolichyl-phosphate beta-glucosyltransferase n=1 Tax=Spongisporangium articulatum TaxID=3362603 RepID=A0ABW8AME4_9ACTN